MVPIVRKTGSQRRDVNKEIRLHYDELRLNGLSFSVTIQQIELHTFSQEWAQRLVICLDAHLTIIRGGINTRIIPCSHHTTDVALVHLSRQRSGSATDGNTCHQLVGNILLENG